MRPFTQERLGELLAESPSNTFWRHDVDVSPLAALEMATLEADLGIDATFYVMTTSPFYTPVEAFDLAVALSDLGHLVGTHFDWRVSRLPHNGPFSFHCPRESELWRDDIQPQRNAYASEWKGRYVSDSRGVFAHGDPEDRFDGEPLQVNLHPEWWFEPDWVDEIPDSAYELFFHEPKSRLHDRASSTAFDSSARAGAAVDPPAASANHWQGAVGLRGAGY